MMKDTPPLHNTFESCENGDILPETLTPACREAFANQFSESPETIRRLSSWPGEIGSKARLAVKCATYLDKREGMI